MFRRWRATFFPNAVLAQGPSTSTSFTGFLLKPDAGQVFYQDRNCTTWSVQRRARAGLVRSFQDAALFPGLTTVECIALALHGHRNGERQLIEAQRIADSMGLAGYLQARISELSTGTRRIVELTCIAAQRPQLVLLDEPTSGLSQAETQALVSVLTRMNEAESMAIVVVEHDIEFVDKFADRVLTMNMPSTVGAGQLTHRTSGSKLAQ